MPLPFMCKVKCTFVHTRAHNAHTFLEDTGYSIEEINYVFLLYQYL